jgi:putative membrane protein
MSLLVYKIVLSLHLISVIFWLAALFYLPRLYVYHADTAPDSAQWRLFNLMEQRLLQIIATPSMLSAWIFGLVLFLHADWTALWLWAKLVLVLLLSGYHGACAGWRKGFLSGSAPKSSGFFRKINEVAPILAIFIVFLAILKPFE